MTAVLDMTRLSAPAVHAIVHGCRVVADEEAVSALIAAEDSAVTEPTATSAEDRFLRGSLAACVHGMMKAKEGCRASLVRSLLSMLSSPLTANHLSAIVGDVPLTPTERKILYYPNTPSAVSLCVAAARLQKLAHVASAAFALYLEATGKSAEFLKEENFAVAGRGLKDAIADLESLLENSKLGKSGDISAEVAETPCALGNLYETLEAATRAAEDEVNAEVRSSKSFSTPKVLAQRSSALLAAVTDLVQLAKARVVHLGSVTTSEETATDLHAAIEQLSSLCGQEISLSSASLRAREEPNEGRARKPLPCGKGTRQLLTEFTTAEMIEELVAGRHAAFIDKLLEAKNEERRKPKIPKGMKDYGPSEMAIRSHVFNCIRKVFQNHCAGELDTPVMELKETLLGKYGEEANKLIYELADQGGEILALRYDLTVPLARYVAMNGITRLKRFHIGKVYRRDQPQVSRGRYREFYQCDFDTVGPGSLMAQDAECLKIVSEILAELKIPYKMKVNHRKLLDACLEIAGCPPAKFRSVSSTIDKLDKDPWERVRAELIEDKGLLPETADSIGELVKIHGSVEATTQLLLADPRMQQHPTAPAILHEMEVLNGFLKCMRIEHEVEFDLSLARGLDYYTGLVYEAQLTDNQIGIGSIGGGGRYDELIQKLNGSKTQTPAVGVSLGIERLFAIVEKREDSLASARRMAVLVAQAGKSTKYNLFEERWRLCCELWAHEIAAETSYKEKSDPEGQVRRADEEKMLWTVWLGESELDAGVVKAKNMREHTEAVVPLAELVTFLKNNSR